MNAKASLRVSLLLGIAWGAVGCRKVDSTGVLTSQLYAQIVVREQSTGARVDATLWVGGALSNEALELTGPDHLDVHVGSDVYPMQGYSDVDQHYSALIPYPATDTEVRVAFERGPGDVSAPDSTVIVPGVFVLAPLAQTQYSRANDALEIAWAPFDPTQFVSWVVSGACVQAFGAYGAADPGEVAIPAGTLQMPPPPGPDEEHHPIPPDQCAAEVDVTKARDGQVDPAFSGGTFTASLERSATFTSVP